MARMIDLNVTTNWWVPAATITDPSAISAAALTAAETISQFVHSSTRVMPTTSDTVSERSPRESKMCSRGGNPFAARPCAIIPAEP